MPTNNISEDLGITYEVANVEDASGIHDALMQNLIEIDDFKKIAKKDVKTIEDKGFLRKDVSTQEYIKIIKEKSSLIYVAKKNDLIVGFASIHRNKYDVREFRSTLENIYTDNEKVRNLLTSKELEFIYLDQVSIYPEYKGKKIGKNLFYKIISDNMSPIVSFIVKKPLANNASARWHEHLGFKMEATCDGRYKKKHFEWWIYIYWNN